MMIAPEQPLETLGLGGDGDEMLAIEHVERSFGVELDKSQASQWHTVGDVFQALKQSLPAYERSRRDLWPRFAVAIAHESGVDPTRIMPGTRLLAGGTGRWPLLMVAGVLGLAYAVYQAIP